MIENRLEVTLQQPPERAFDFFVDFRNEPAWNPDCLTVEKTSDGPIAVGTTFTGKMKRVGPSTSEIVAFDRPERCSVVDRSRGAHGTFEFRRRITAERAWTSRCECSRAVRCGCSSP